jgi:curved DNA-binding protein CbpA
MSDHYNLLGLHPDAGAEEIRAAFRRLAKQTHPDAHPRAPERERAAAQARFVQLAQAYDVLSDPARRREYDRARRTSSRPAAAPGAPPGGRARPGAARAQEPPRPERPRARAGPAADAGPRRPPGPPPRAARRAVPRKDGRRPDFADLGDDIEALLRSLGLSLRSPAQRVWDALLAWAKDRLREAATPAAGPGRPGMRGSAGGAWPGPAAPVGRPDRRAEELELERELEGLKDEVRSGRRRARSSPREQSLEAELAELKRTLGKK